MKKSQQPKKEVLKNKPRSYKVGDLVQVDFIGQIHLGRIITIYQPNDWPLRWAYKVRLQDGYIIPYVGIEGTEKFCNIIVAKKE
jgi:hypothetical protein